MKRCIINFLVALITFTFGAIFVYKYHFDVYPSKIQKTTISKKVKSPTPQNNYLIKKDEFLNKADNDNCESDSETINLKPILREWIKRTKFKDANYCAETVKPFNDYSPKLVTPTLIDINGDGMEELALKSGCSPTGNCEFEIFEKTKKGYRRILNAVRDVNMFKLEKSSFKSYRNIKTTMHGSYNSGDGIIYKYNGRNYKPHKCFQYLYEEYKDSEGITINKETPTILYFKCADPEITQ